MAINWGGIYAEARCEEHKVDSIRQKTKRDGFRNGYQELEATEGQPSRGAAGAHQGNKTTSTSVPNEVPKNFLNKLGEMHSAEQQLTLALPLVAAAAKSKDPKILLQIHLKETKGHVRALEDVATSLGTTLPSKSCKEMTKLITEGVKVIAKRLVSGDKDQELIEIGRNIEQLEIDNYAPLIAQAERMEFTHETALLTSIFNQEKLAKKLLGALGRGEGPLDKLVKKVSLEHADRQTATAELHSH